MYICKRDLAALALIGGAIPLGAIASDTEALRAQRPVTLVIGYPPGGTPLQPNTPEMLADLIDEETERWTTILRE